MCSVLSQERTILPVSSEQRFDLTGAALGSVLGEGQPNGQCYREGVALYTNSAGIDTGYGFFAPSVASTHKLAFEIQYADGRREYDVPAVGGSATGLRLTLLFDHIARARLPLLRETMVRLMAYAVWREHPQAEVIRAVFGTMNFPSAADFARGEKPSYDLGFAYDFKFGPAPVSP